MKWSAIVAGVFWFVFLLVSVGNCEEDSFNTEKMLSELETKLALSKEKLKSLKPTIDEKSRELKKEIQESVDKGFVQLEEMTQTLDKVSEDTEEKVKSFLNSDEIQKLKDYLGKIDKDAVKRTQERLVAELVELLELSEAQIEELKPVLQDSMVQMNEIIDELAKEGRKNWGAFKKQYDQLSRELKEKLQEKLDNSQMEKLEKYNKEKQENIKKALFV